MSINQLKNSGIESLVSSAKKKPVKSKQDRSLNVSGTTGTLRGDSILDEVEANIANRWGLVGSSQS